MLPAPLHRSRIAPTFVGLLNQGEGRKVETALFIIGFGYVGLSIAALVNLFLRGRPPRR